MIARLIIVLLAAAPLAAHAQSFRCVGKDGKKYYGSTIPPQCAGQTVEQLSAQGTVIRRIDPSADSKAREEKAAAEAKKRQEETTVKEAARRRNALAATYASEKDIEDARARALAENARAVNDIQARLEAAKKGKGGGDAKTLEGMLAAKRREAADINARYDEDRKDYLQLVKGR
jgi:hypothetical protein